MNYFPHYTIARDIETSTMNHGRQITDLFICYTVLLVLNGDSLTMRSNRLLKVTRHKTREIIIVNVGDYFWTISP